MEKKIYMRPRIVEMTMVTRHLMDNWSANTGSGDGKSASTDPDVSQGFIYSGNDVLSREINWFEDYD